METEEEGMGRWRDEGEGLEEEDEGEEAVAKV